MLVAGLLSTLITLAIGAGAASAHEASLVASADCAGTVSYTVTSWSAGLPGSNAAIQITDSFFDSSGTWTDLIVQNGAFGNLPTVPTISGTFPWPAGNPDSIWVSVNVLAPWGDGATAAISTSVQVSRPQTCIPGTPSATATAVCANGTGTVAGTLTVGPGTGSVTFTVTLPAPAAAQTFTVPSGTSQNYSIPNLGNGTVTVTAPGMSTVTTTIACTAGSATATPSVACVNHNGDVTVTLAYTGGDLPIDVVLDGVTYTLSAQVPTKTVTFPGQADGTFSKTIKIGSAAATVVTLDVACDSKLTATIVCNELDVSGTAVSYWFKISNNDSLPLAITWADGAVTIPANSSVNVKTANKHIDVSSTGNPVVSADAAGNACGTTVNFTKSLIGQPATGETYTVTVSRLVGASYVPALTFDLLAGVTKTFTLPSTFDPAGITYKVDETNAGTAQIHTVTPSSFTLNGNLGQAVSVAITNGYASVALDKQVSATKVKGGDQLQYTLVATNTGGLTLDPVIVADSLPPEVSLVSALVAGGKGDCTLAKADKPQLVECVMNDPLAPGAKTATITLVTTVDASVAIDAQFLNQAKVLGTYAGNPTPPSSSRTDEITRLRSAVQANPVSCIPVVAGTVCNLSAKVGTTVVSGTDSESPVPTTTPVTTPDMTVPAIASLPVTGASRISNMLTIGFVLLSLGGLAMFARRRRPTIN